jgi:hypothetical protein
MSVAALRNILRSRKKLLIDVLRITGEKGNDTNARRKRGRQHADV